jgi:hypothetical protein
MGQYSRFNQRLEQMNQGERFYGPTAQKLKNDKIIFGNCSRFAKNWVGGPNNEIRKQHVPGYTGHIKGLIAENINGNNFANCSALAIYKKGPQGHNLKPKHRFLSSSSSQFVPKNFRRFGKYQ